MWNLKVVGIKEIVKTVEEFFFYCSDHGEKHNFYSFNVSLEEVGFKKINLETFNSLVEADRQRKERGDWHYLPHLGTKFTDFVFDIKLSKESIEGMILGKEFIKNDLINFLKVHGFCVSSEEYSKEISVVADNGGEEFVVKFKMLSEKQLGYMSKIKVIEII